MEKVSIAEMEKDAIAEMEKVFNILEDHPSELKFVELKSFFEPNHERWGKILKETNIEILRGEVQEWKTHDTKEREFLTKKLKLIKLKKSLQEQWKQIASLKKTTPKQFCKGNPPLSETSFSRWLKFSNKLTHDIKRQIEEKVIDYLNSREENTELLR
jgi:hypothetical protein